MSFLNEIPDDEMSMEDILSSIRRYVSEEEEKKTSDDSYSTKSMNGPEDKVIKLDASHMVSTSQKVEQVVENESPYPEKPEVYDERSTLSSSVSDKGVKAESTPSSQRKPGPFEQLTNALNSYGRRKQEKPAAQFCGTQTVDQFFSEIVAMVVQKWIDANMESIVEKIVMREIEKIKSE